MLGCELILEIIHIKSFGFFQTTDIYTHVAMQKEGLGLVHVIYQIINSPNSSTPAMPQTMHSGDISKQRLSPTILTSHFKTILSPKLYIYSVHE